MTEEFLHVCLIPGCTRNKQPFGNRPNLKRHLREGHRQRHGIRRAGRMDTASPSTAEEPTTVDLSTVTAESLIDSRRASKRPLQDGGQERKRSSQDLCQARNGTLATQVAARSIAHQIATSSWPRQRLGHGAYDDCSTTKREPQPDWSSASLTETS
jgi:hypothetical protein